MSTGPLCPDCGRPTTVLVFLIICAYCQIAMKPIDYALRQRSREWEAETDAADAQRQGTD